MCNNIYLNQKHTVLFITYLSRFVIRTLTFFLCFLCVYVRSGCLIFFIIFSVLALYLYLCMCLCVSGVVFSLPVPWGSASEATSETISLESAPFPWECSQTITDGGDLKGNRIWLTVRIAQLRAICRWWTEDGSGDNFRCFVVGASLCSVRTWAISYQCLRSLGIYLCLPSGLWLLSELPAAHTEVLTLHALRVCTKLTGIGSRKGGKGSWRVCVYLCEWVCVCGFVCGGLCGGDLTLHSTHCLGDEADDLKKEINAADVIVRFTQITGPTQVQLHLQLTAGPDPLQRSAVSVWALPISSKN